MSNYVSLDARFYSNLLSRILQSPRYHLSGFLFTQRSQLLSKPYARDTVVVLNIRSTAKYGPVAPEINLATQMWLLSSIGTRLLTINSHRRQILACLRHSKATLSIKINIPTTNSPYLENNIRRGPSSMISPIPFRFPIFYTAPSPSPYIFPSFIKTRCLARSPKTTRLFDLLLPVPKWHTIVPMLMSSSPSSSTAPPFPAQYVANSIIARVASAAIKKLTIQMRRSTTRFFSFKASSTHASVLQIPMSFRRLQEGHGPESQHGQPYSFKTVCQLRSPFTFDISFLLPSAQARGRTYATSLAVGKISPPVEASHVTNKVANTRELPVPYPMY
ncbi:hypothetical protein EDD18DRAFT_1163141 [Armillaria luteobubalina]|uniref:Uncharacterized protein n=1 Tax=Armillaria luteobubalina TaxID=153913 RepID=A0AA39Q5P5_9AGAR|nr:hypothetical protein EDD18DRAFT_1163141 [Armillaria luteobubalina]